MSRQRPKSASKKMRDYRARLRAQGLRPIQMWVPDTRTPEFAAEARRQSSIAAARFRGSEDETFMNLLVDEIFVELDAADK